MPTNHASGTSLSRRALLRILVGLSVLATLLIPAAPSASAQTSDTQSRPTQSSEKGDQPVRGQQPQPEKDAGDKSDEAETADDTRTNERVPSEALAPSGSVALVGPSEGLTLVAEPSAPDDPVWGKAAIELPGSTKGLSSPIESCLRVSDAPGVKAWANYNYYFFEIPSEAGGWQGSYQLFATEDPLLVPDEADFWLRPGQDFCKIAPNDWMTAYGSAEYFEIVNFGPRCYPTLADTDQVAGIRPHFSLSEHDQPVGYEVYVADAVDEGWLLGAFFELLDSGEQVCVPDHEGPQRENLSFLNLAKVDPGIVPPDLGGTGDAPLECWELWYVPVGTMQADDYDRWWDECEVWSGGQPMQNYFEAMTLRIELHNDSPNTVIFQMPVIGQYLGENGNRPWPPAAEIEQQLAACSGFIDNWIEGTETGFIYGLPITADGTASQLASLAAGYRAFASSPANSESQRFYGHNLLAQLSNPHTVIQLMEARDALYTGLVAAGIEVELNNIVDRIGEFATPLGTLFWDLWELISICESSPSAPSTPWIWPADPTGTQVEPTLEEVDECLANPNLLASFQALNASVATFVNLSSVPPEPGSTGFDQWDAQFSAASAAMDSAEATYANAIISANDELLSALGEYDGQFVVSLINYFIAENGAALDPVELGALDNLRLIAEQAASNQQTLGTYLASFTPDPLGLGWLSLLCDLAQTVQDLGADFEPATSTEDDIALLVDCPWSQPATDAAGATLASTDLADTAAANLAINEFWTEYRDDQSFHDIALETTGPDDATYNVLTDLAADWLATTPNPNSTAVAGLDALDRLLARSSLYAAGSSASASFANLGDFLDAYIADSNVAPAEKAARLADLCRAIEATHDHVLQSYASPVFGPVAGQPTSNGDLAELAACAALEDTSLFLNLDLSRQHVSLLESNGAYRAETWWKLRQQLETLLDRTARKADLPLDSLDNGSEAAAVAAALGDYLDLFPDATFADLAAADLDAIEQNTTSMRTQLTRTPNRSTTLIINKICELALFQHQLDDALEQLSEHCTHDNEVFDARLELTEAETLGETVASSDALWQVLMADITEYAPTSLSDREALSSLYRGAELYWYYLDANYRSWDLTSEGNLQLGSFNKPNKLAEYLQLLGDAIVDLPALAANNPEKPETLIEELQLMGAICRAIRAVEIAGRVIEDGIAHVEALDAESETDAGWATPFDWSTTCVASGVHDTNDTSGTECVRRLDLFANDFSLASYSCSAGPGVWDPSTHHVVVRVSDGASMSLADIQSELEMSASGCSATFDASNLIDLADSGEIELLSYDGAVPLTVPDGTIRKWTLAVQTAYLSDFDGDGAADLEPFSGVIEAFNGPFTIPPEHSIQVFDEDGPNVPSAQMFVRVEAKLPVGAMGNSLLGRPIDSDLANQGRVFGLAVVVPRTNSSSILWSWNTDNMVATLHHELTHVAQKYEMANIVVDKRSEPLTRLGVNTGLLATNTERVPTREMLPYRTTPAVSALSLDSDTFITQLCQALDCTSNDWVPLSTQADTWVITDYTGAMTTTQMQLAELAPMFEATWP